MRHPYDDGAWPFIPAPRDRRARCGAAPFCVAARGRCHSFVSRRNLT
ncbi:hypothetical protein BURMUCGD2M_3984 [Burkholderia multivorans CGD2M]|uniref:Uncharacterized protein n=1 Tax=Burkholderia multivorans CGD2 TaxID=513052 RepID=B9BRH8_9BURK|nr:hypothetical protein BURMUCGD2_3995 [Burkholderia multivorans CGD2]EEE12020.1 hypothetical protein BURMUCGD2M_3984 [Burkholderia multivorans CGD2M]